MIYGERKEAMKISKQVFFLEAKLCLSFLSRVCHFHQPYAMFVIYFCCRKEVFYIPLMCQIITSKIKYLMLLFIHNNIEI